MKEEQTKLPEDCHELMDKICRTGSLNSTMNGSNVNMLIRSMDYGIERIDRINRADRNRSGNSLKNT